MMENYFMNYDPTTGEVKGFYLKSIHDYIPIPNLELTPYQYDRYMANNGKLRWNVDMLDFENLPEFTEGSDQYKEQMHQQLKAQCTIDIMGFGENKAQSLAMKQHMGNPLTAEEGQYINDFILARDNRLAQYESDKAKYGIT